MTAMVQDQKLEVNSSQAEETEDRVEGPEVVRLQEDMELL
jgi:hypothetical protein